MKLSNKLLFSYMVLLMIVFFITITITNTFVTKKLTSQAKIQLEEQADSLLATMDQSRFDLDEPRKVLAYFRNAQIGSLIPSDLFLLSPKKRVLYASNVDYSEEDIQSIVSNDHPDYIRVVRPLKMDEETAGYILLISEVKYIRNGVVTLRRSLLFGMLIASVCSAIIALVMKNMIVKPIVSLKNDIIKNQDDPLHPITPITTQDEIEELYLAYVAMNTSIVDHLDERKRFFQNASHELKTPLMSIQGYAEAIIDGVIEGDEVQKSLGIIVNKSQQLKKTVEEIIYLSKLVNKDFEYTFKETDIVAVVQLAIEDMSLLASEKGINIHVVSDAPQMLALIDGSKFESVMENLLSNAIRYAKTLIRVEVKDHPKEWLIRVIDDGDGLKEDEVNKVFERFYKGELGNTGIGLAIVAEIVHGHHGKIRAGNHIGGGAAFEITLTKERYA